MCATTTPSNTTASTAAKLLPPIGAVCPSCAGAGEGGLSRTSLPLTLAETAEMVALETERIVQRVFVGGSRALSVTPDTTVPLLHWVCRVWGDVHDLPETLGAVRELVLVQSVVGGRNEVSGRRGGQVLSRVATRHLL